MPSDEEHRTVTGRAAFSDEEYMAAIREIEYSSGLEYEHVILGALSDARAMAAWTADMRRKRRAYDLQDKS